MALIKGVIRIEIHGLLSIRFVTCTAILSTHVFDYSKSKGQPKFKVWGKKLPLDRRVYKILWLFVQSPQ